jgi:hypothetical protein
MNLDPGASSLTEFLAWEARPLTNHEYREGAVLDTPRTPDDRNQLVVIVGILSQTPPPSSRREARRVSNDAYQRRAATLPYGEIT